MTMKEQGLKMLKDVNRELKESLVVISHLETRQSQLLKEQSEYLASHEIRLRESERRNKDVDARIEKLVCAIGVLIQKT